MKEQEPIEHKADSLIAKLKKRAERSERLMYEQSHRAIISALVICIIVRLSWAVNHYRVIIAIAYKKPSATKKCQRTEAGERGQLLGYADASA